MAVILVLIGTLLISAFFIFLAKFLRISSIIGLIGAGLIIGATGLGGWVLDDQVSLILKLGDFGLVALMFLAGLEISWREFCKEEGIAFKISVFAFIFPALLGFVVFYLLGYSWSVALIVGICMSITAEATNAEILIELKKIKTKIGSLLLGAGIMDDLLGMLLFALISFLLAGSIATKELLMLAFALVAFFIGVVVHHFIGREKRLISLIEKAFMYLLIPFFFIAMGLNFDFHALRLTPWLLIGIIFIAIVGKIGGCLISRPFTHLKWKQLYLIGWGMNSRGAVELAIAFIAFKANLLDATLYSGLVVMALVTTMSFPFFMTRMIKADPKIMN